jgi:hypothetical protein
VGELLFRGHRDVVDADLADYLDPASYCTHGFQACSNRLVCDRITLRRKPFCLPRRT